MTSDKLAELLKTYSTVAIAAERLGIGTRAVQTACSRGLLPGSIRIGRVWFLPPATVENRLEKHGKGKRSCRKSLPA